MQTNKYNSTRSKLTSAIVETLDRRTMMSASIGGYLIADNNANYAWDAGDTRNAGWTAYLDLNNNATLDTGEPSAIAAVNGYFQIDGLEAGTYKLRQVLQSGWRQTFPRNADFREITVVDGQLGGGSFGATQAMSNVTGVVFNDANSNGVRDAGEVVDAFRAVYIDANDNGQNDLGELWTTTSANGEFSFTGLPAGEYRMRLLGRNGWTQTFGGDSAVAVVNGSDSVVGMQFGHYQLPEPTSYNANNVMSFMLVGASSDVVADRRVGFNIKQEGWAGFVADYIQPQLDWGIRRIMLHNPFGTLPGENYRADQAIEARDAGLNWLLDGFVEAWTPIIQQGVEVVAYMGSPMNDPTFMGLDDAAWWARVWDSFDLPVRAGMKIGLDMSLGAQVGDRDWQFVEELRARGLDVYGEPRPPESALHWRSSNLFAEDHIWLSTDPERNPETAWAARDAQITGDVVRLLSVPPAGKTWANFAQWLPGEAQRILREGHTVAFNPMSLINGGMTLAQVLTPTPSAARSTGNDRYEPGDASDDFLRGRLGDWRRDLDVFADDRVEFDLV